MKEANFLGVILVLLSSLSFALSTIFGKVLTNNTNMSGVVTSFTRFVLGTIVMLLYILIKKKSLKPVNIKPILIRGICNSLAISIFAMSFKYTTITNANMLHMTYPVFVILLAPYFLNEKPNKSNYIYLLIIMVSSYIIVNPKFNSVNIGDIISLASAIIAALSIMTLTAARKSDEAYLIIFYVMLIGTVINFPLAFKDLASFEMRGLVPMLLSGLLGVVGQILITWGYKYVDSATGALVSSSRIVMVSLMGILFLSEPINARVIIGTILNTGSLVGLSGYFSRRREGKEVQINNE